MRADDGGRRGPSEFEQTCHARRAVLVSAVLLAGCDWVIYRSNAAHTGASSGEKVICVGNVATLSEAWTTPDDVVAGTVGSPPIVAGGRLYVQTVNGFISAYDARGVDNCGGSPKQCQPVWKAQPGGGTILAVVGRRRVRRNAGRGWLPVDGVLLAYDAAGTTGCSGSPPTCQPLWTAPLGAGSTFVSSPTLRAASCTSRQSPCLPTCSSRSTRPASKTAPARRRCVHRSGLRPSVREHRLAIPRLVRRRSRVGVSSYRVQSSSTVQTTRFMCLMQRDSRTATAYPSNVSHCGRPMFLLSLAARRSARYPCPLSRTASSTRSTVIASAPSTLWAFRDVREHRRSAHRS
jgi:hypothetical protein